MCKKIILSCLLIIFAVYLSGCIDYYASANLGTAMNYVPKPVYEKKDTTAVYVGGAYSHTFRGAYSTEDQIDMGQLSLHKSITSKNYNLAYGGIAHLGSYRASYIPFDTNLQNAAASIAGDKLFWGLGAFAEANLNINSDDLDFRVIGISGSIYYEGGEFAEYRSQLDQLTTSLGNSFDEVGDLHPNSVTYEIAFNSELILKTNSANFGVKASIGAIKGHEQANVIAGTTFFITKDRWTISTRFAASVYMDGGLTSFGLNYRIK